MNLKKMIRIQTPNKKFKVKSTISKVRTKGGSESFEISNEKKKCSGLNGEFILGYQITRDINGEWSI